MSAAILLTLAGSAQAAFPGANGRIVFTKADGTGRIHSINADGTGELQLTNGPDYDRNPRWSPDGRKIVFERHVGHPANPAEIFVMNADGSGQTRLTTDTVHDVTPYWSPDGQRIVFVRGPIGGPYGIYVMNADGSALTSIVSGADSPAAWSPSVPKWSPDGSKIAFYRLTDAGDGPALAVFTVNPDGTGLTRHTTPSNFGSPEIPETCYREEHAEPDWAPDRSRNLLIYHGGWFNCDPESSSFGSLKIISLDTPYERTLFSPSVISPDWSPDGQKIAYRSSGDWVTVVNLDGTGGVSLAPGYAPDWQPLHRPQRSDYKNAAQFCKAERTFLGDSGFGQKYDGGANAHGKCVSGR